MLVERRLRVPVDLLDSVLDKHDLLEHILPRAGIHTQSHGSVAFGEDAPELGLTGLVFQAEELLVDSVRVHELARFVKLGREFVLPGALQLYLQVFKFPTDPLSIVKVTDLSRPPISFHLHNRRSL